MSQDNKPLVSIIMPTHNRRHTIKKAIDSVYSQTYNNFELVIVDDASSDNTLDYVSQNWGEKENLIYLVNETNLGPAASRNAGVNAAHGSYIAFLDSDDEWYPTFLEKSMQRFLECDEDTALVYSVLKRERSDGSNDFWPPYDLDNKYKDTLLFFFLLGAPLIPVISEVVKKDGFIKVGGFLESLQAMEDYEFSIKLAKEYKASFINEPLAVSHESFGSVSSRSHAVLAAHIYIMKKYVAYYPAFDMIQAKFSNVYSSLKTLGLHEQFRKEVLDDDSLSVFHDIAKDFNT